MTRDEILLEMGISPLWRLRDGVHLPGAPQRRTADDAAPANDGAAAATTPDAPSAKAARADADPAALAPAVEVGDVADRPMLPADDASDSDGPAGAADADDYGQAQPEPPRHPRPEPQSRPQSPPQAAAPTGAPDVPDAGPERAGVIARLDWDGLAAATAACRACGLCRQRKQAVLGVGDRQPGWLVIGEGPGEQEDERGEPFVGPAGQLLDAMLAAVGLQRGAGVYIANAVKCRPPGNRNPTPEEIAACRPFLLRQIALLSPKLIVLLGRTAVASLLDRDSPLAGMRGRVHRHGDTPVVVTYHPAYLLRTLPDKARAWEDLCLARRTWPGLAAAAAAKPGAGA